MSEGLSQQVTNLLAFAGGSNVPSDAIFIAVMGVTGAGKSTFVSQCTGKAVDVGHDLLSCKPSLAMRKKTAHHSVASHDRDQCI